MARFVILSGPSCVGKGPLFAALARFYPDQAAHLRHLILYNSRAPRPGETDGVDYHFRTRRQVERLRDHDGFLVIDVRGDLQALDLEGLSQAGAAGDVFFEGNPFVVEKLLARGLPKELEKLSVFLAPLSRAEILYLRAPERNLSLPDFVAALMRRKLLRRTTRQRTHLSLPDLQDIERRATSAYVEMQQAWRFDFVIPNHDGEDSDHWDALYYPVGDARRTLLTFVELLAGGTPADAERWDEDLLP